MHYFTPSSFPFHIRIILLVSMYVCITVMGRRGSDRMKVGFTTTCAISAHHH